jgi:polyketide synthase PksN
MNTVLYFLEKLAAKNIKLDLEGDSLNCYSPEGAITSEIGDKITKYKQEIINLLRDSKKIDCTILSDYEALEQQRFPLSIGEKGLYHLQKLHPEMSAYNVPLCFKMNSEVNHIILEKAWYHVLDKFPILTARIEEKDGEAYHLLNSKNKMNIQHKSIDFVEEQQRLLFLQTQASRPFNLNEEPLARIHLFTQNDQKSILLITIHHIIFDGTSAVFLLKSLFDFYQQLCQNKTIKFAINKSNYARFVDWEKQMLASSEGNVHAGYWERQLSGDLPRFDMLTDFSPKGEISFEGETITKTLSLELTHWMSDYSQREALQPSVIFLALFQLLLSKYSNQKEIIVGMPVMGRPTPEFDELIGYFINMVPLRTNCDDKLHINDYFRQVQGTLLDALYHSSYPFPLMLESLKNNSTGKNPIFQVSYAYQNFIRESDYENITLFNELGIEEFSGINQVGGFDLGMEIIEKPSQFEIQIKYSPDIFEASTINELFSRYLNLMEEISQKPNKQLKDYSLMDCHERQRLLVEYNDNNADYPSENSIHQLFIQQVQKNPEQIAVVFEEEKLSYQELYDKSYILAMFLQSHGVGADTIVALCVDRTIEMIIGILGILQAGGGYIPMEPDFPTERLTDMLADSKAGIVLTQDKYYRKFIGTETSKVKMINIDTQWEEIKQHTQELINKHTYLIDVAKSNNLAYIIYTSGSTGKPKGVMIEHGAVVDYAYSVVDRMELKECDSFGYFSTFAADLGNLALFVPIIFGKTIHIYSNDMVRDPIQFFHSIEKLPVDCMKMTPSHFEILKLSDIQAVLPVKVLIFAGEPLTRETLDKVQAISPKLRVYNNYGPTETTISKLSTSNLFVSKNEPITLGKPLNNAQLYILDKNNQLQPHGIPGELHISGYGVARGYLNRTELNNEKFIANPFKPGERLYKTGDLGRWLADGTVEYLGRIDTQVKMRGFRIETEEIEAQLNQHSDVKDSVVVVHGKEENKQLIAFYLLCEAKNDSLTTPTNESLIAYLQKSLPTYMVPVKFVRLEFIPLTSNGKIDRRMLELTPVSIESTQAYLAPRNDIEQQLVDIWAQVLDQPAETIGINDNFFERGGHSLLLTKVLSMLRKQFEVDVPLKALFDAHSLSDTVEVIVAIQNQFAQSLNEKKVEEGEYEEISL